MPTSSPMMAASGWCATLPPDPFHHQHSAIARRMIAPTIIDRALAFLRILPYLALFADMVIVVGELSRGHWRHCSRRLHRLCRWRHDADAVKSALTASAQAICDPLMGKSHGPRHHNLHCFGHHSRRNPHADLTDLSKPSASLQTNAVDGPIQRLFQGRRTHRPARSARKTNSQWSLHRQLGILFAGYCRLSRRRRCHTGASGALSRTTEGIVEAVGGFEDRVWPDRSLPDRRVADRPRIIRRGALCCADLDAQHPKSSAIYKLAGRLPHLMVSASENDATEAAHREKEIDRTDDEHGGQWAPDQSDIGAAEEHGLSERHEVRRRAGCSHTVLQPDRHALHRRGDAGQQLGDDEDRHRQQPKLAYGRRQRAEQDAESRNRERIKGCAEEEEKERAGDRCADPPVNDELQ